MSLRLRLVVAAAYVLVLVLVVLEVPLTLNVERRVDAEVKAEAAGETYLLAAGASGRLSNPAALDRLIARAAADLDARVIVVDSGGLLLADSAGPGLRSRSYADRAEIRTALVAGRAAQGTRHSATLDQDLLYTAVPIVSEGRRVGAVRVTQSVAAIQREVRRNVVALAAIGGPPSSSASGSPGCSPARCHAHCARWPPRRAGSKRAT